jgi:hypothetical protein
MTYRKTWTGLLGLILAAGAHAAVLYDAGGLAMPHQAPWAWTLGGGGGSVSPPASGTLFTRLNTTATSSIQQGWLQTAPSSLDRFSGYEVRFDLRINSESHANNDRAGLSVIVLSQDLRGIELSFWTNEVWAQNDAPLFTHGEGAAHNTMAGGTGQGGLQRYRLRIAGNAYALFAEDAPLLNGALRDYTAFAGFPDPYETPNFLWVGDNAQSSSSSADFSRFEVAAVPEPGILAGLSFGLLAWKRRRH